MGLTYIEGKVIGNNDETATVNFLVDSGANYTLLTKDIWERLGLKAKKTLNFTLADGTKIERDISECRIEILGEDFHTPVILGEEGDESLLGAVTLEILGVVLNPFNRSLQPMRMMLA
ncbi:MAG: clan AA aspartic protease [Acidobacteria bacterium]|jgi:clan AA aspartic protease|nr:clan AA aspartic protease [Acidobacteriota bacterium]MBA4122849.1 clan AA aspartic protease [Acidobacteriota bacterium]MBA4182521.1 clan AA aspartic protease [Acidobacteriota bacterium]